MEIKYFFQLSGDYGDGNNGHWKDLNFRIKPINGITTHTFGLASDGRLSTTMSVRISEYPKDEIIFKWKSGDRYD